VTGKRVTGIMSGLAFTGDMARLQQAIAEAHDLVVRRGTVLAALNLRTGERVLELGCGGGYFAREAAPVGLKEGREAFVLVQLTPPRGQRLEYRKLAGLDHGTIVQPGE